MAIIKIQGFQEIEKGIYYEVDSNSQPIGEGGTGKVYAGMMVNARSGLKRRVAIKFLFDNLSQELLEKARREASIQLKNDNLVEMLGMSEVEETNSLGEKVKHYHIASELLEGLTLAEVMEGRTTDASGKENAFAQKMYNDYLHNTEEFAITIVKNVLSGLMALHDAGYIHRDIDPTNIMLTNDGKIKLIDFGISKHISLLNTQDKSCTVAGIFMGKPEYAAPELVLGDVKHHNQTTDIYAVGILLYQCITGHLPFEGLPRNEILELQLKKALPLKDVHNRQLRDIISNATAKKQNERFQSVSEFRVKLEQVTPGGGGGGGEVSVGLVVGIAAAVGLAVGAALGLFLYLS